MCTFCTVEHEELFADVDDLRGTESARGWECGAAAEYVDGECLHGSGWELMGVNGNDGNLMRFYSLGVALAEGEEVAVGAVVLVGALGEGAVGGGVVFVGGEDFVDLGCEEGGEGVGVLGLVVGDLLFLPVGGGGELDDAGVVVAVVLGAVHEGWDNGIVDS